MILGKWSKPVWKHSKDPYTTKEADFKDRRGGRERIIDPRERETVPWAQTYPG